MKTRTITLTEAEAEVMFWLTGLALDQRPDDEFAHIWQAVRGKLVDAPLVEDAAHD